MQNTRSLDVAGPSVPRGWIILGLALASWALIAVLWQVFSAIRAAFFG